MFAYISGSPFVFIEVFHVSRQNFGLFFSITAACLMLGVTTNRLLLSRCAPDVLLRRGVEMIFAAGLLLALLAWLRVGGLAGVVGPMMLYLFGLGWVQPNATAAAMAPHGRLAGVSSSVIGGMQTVGGALAGYCVGAFYDHSSRSLALTVAALATLALLTLNRDPDNGTPTSGAEPAAAMTPAVQVTHD
jgi:DHA1 family bicyclomycin/chloramphenicol resistance-like MFS transporter